MNDARFIIIGAKGQLGISLGNLYPNAVKVDREELDITNQESVMAYDWSTVDVILNAAAFTNVDGAESADGRVASWQVNAVAVGYLARVASEHNITLVHISSEYVFDGTKSPHTEDEPFSPLGVYAQTKAAGEIAAAVAPKHYIMRTSWLIGEGQNFVRTMIGLAQKNISPSVVGDQVGRITFTKTLTSAIDHVLKTNAPFGTYNLSDGGEPASWANITREIFKDLGRDDLQVTDVTTADYFANKPDASPRPLQSTMDLQKIESSGFTLPDWRDGLRDYIANETKE
ncbi:MAG TPA: NAD(P)-dependent oxidoreductase [Candidatus Saccharimonadales bacterium]|nr:NAD(P)-dependent oxidoreductase [Candidatus Saccharimonadales bacterium]